MFHNFRYRVALLGLDVQNFGDQILAVSGDVVRVLEVTVHDFLVQGICVGVFEGEVAAHHGKQNNTATPDVDFCTVVLFARYHLWSGVTRRSASRFQSLFRLVRIAEAKVDDFDLAVMIKQQILRLHVPMNYTELMKIVDSWDNLLKELTRFLFTQFVQFNDILKQFTAWDVLGYEVKLPRSFNNLIKLDDIRMSRQF